MGRSDFFSNGDWNFTCDLCGAKNKSKNAMKTWQGLYVCRHHKEIRNPQDFLRGVKDDQTTPWTRPTTVPYTFVGPKIPEPILDTNGIPIVDRPGFALIFDTGS